MSEQEEFEFRHRLEQEQAHAKPAEAPGMLESGARGLAQGASLGFADELVGAGGAAVDAAKKLSLSDIVKDYIANRDQYRQGDEAAQKANPYSFGAGNVAGAIGTAFVPGLNLAKGATLGARAAGAAGLGAITAIGASKHDLTQGDVGGVAKDAALGGAIGAVAQPAIEKVVAPAVGYLSGKAKDLAGWAGKKALNAGFDVPEAVTERYLANPEAVNNAMTKEQVGQKLADTLGEVRRDTGPLNEAAVSTLSTTRDAVQGLEAQRAIEELSKYGDDEARQLASRLADDLKQRRGLVPETALEGLGGARGEWGQPLNLKAAPNAEFLTEQEAHEVKKTLQHLTDYKNPLPSYKQAEARQAAGDMNSTLKSGNTDYASGMDELSANIRTKQDLAQKFGIKNDFSGNNESGYTLSDRTISALKDLGNANKIDRARVLDALKEQGYGDLANDVQNTLAKSRFEGGFTNGSRKAVMGGTLGGAVGHFSGMPGGGWVGSAVGAAAGGAVDKYGGKIAKNILDATILGQKLAQNPATQKFVGAIQSAAAKGQGSLAATHFILSQTEPEYQKAVQSQESP